MGRNKIDIQYIKDDRIRNVNYLIKSSFFYFQKHYIIIKLIIFFRLLSTKERMDY